MESGESMEFVPWIWSPSIRITAGCSLLVSHSVLDASPSGAPFLLSHSVLDALPSGALFPLSHFDPLKCLTLCLRVLLYIFFIEISGGSRWLEEEAGPASSLA